MGCGFFDPEGRTKIAHRFIGVGYESICALVLEGRSRRYGYEKREGRNYEDADHRTRRYAH